MSDRRTYEVTTSKTVRTYIYLIRTADQALESAESAESGLFYNCLSCITFAAFALEAYFNHVGSSLIPHWEHYERKLSPSEKLDLLNDALKLSIDRGTAPFNDFKRLQWFRNFTAHGRTITETVVEEHKLLDSESVPTGDTEWERECTLGNARRYSSSARAMIEQVHTSVGFSDFAFSQQFSAEYEAKGKD